jgi:hypothetical protein
LSLIIGGLCCVGFINCIGLPCVGELEYFRRGPVSRERQQKGNRVVSNETDVVMSAVGLGPESDSELYGYITDPFSRLGGLPTS